MKAAHYLAVLVLVLGCALPVHASDTSLRAPSVELLPPDAVTTHSIVIGGRTTVYTARAGLLLLRDDDRKPLATMFYTAFTTGNPRTRAITFFYNGGPGSSTIWLRMGSFAPMRVVVTNGGMTPPAPYQLVSNKYTLLDKTDLVFVDMPASGYGRIWPGADAKKVFGTDNDISMFAKFIERYLTRFGRWNSPKFLFGESYGTPRSAMLANTLQRDGVSINGVVLQSAILNENLASIEIYGGGDTTDWQYIFNLPSEAAGAWYYHKVPGAPKSLSAYMGEAEHFALTRYREALLQGSLLTPGQYESMAEQVGHYTGLSTRYVRNSNLRIGGSEFLAELQRNKGLSEGFYDSRYHLFMIDREVDRPELEASDASIDAAFVSTWNDYVVSGLHFTTSLSYLTGAYSAIQAAGGWNFKHNGETPLNAAPDLAQAMTYNPHLRVFSANGYYDLVTPFLATLYTLNHLNIAPQLQSHISYGFYPSGHMIYLNVDALAQFHADLERWYEQVLRS